MPAPTSYYTLASPTSSQQQQDFDMSLNQYPGFDQSIRGRHSMGPSQHHLHGDNSVMFRMSEMTSPTSSFHGLSGIDMSGLQSSGIGGRLRGEGHWKGDPASGAKDLNNFLPMHKIKFCGDYPRRLHTVENSVTRETIVVLECAQKIMLFLLKIKGDDLVKTAENFEFVKFHELSTQPNDLEGFAISQNCSLTLAPLRLTYALSTRDGKAVYVYDQAQGSNINAIPSELSVEEFAEEESSSLFRFEHDYPVSHLAIDAEKEYLACIQDLGTIVVWDIRQQTKIAIFQIPNNGVYISFHRSEPYQLMVVDSSGWVRFFNVFQNRCFRSIHLIHQHVFSAEWSLCNSNIFAAGFAESFVVIDTCNVLTNKCYEVPEQIINSIKMNPSDDKVFASLSRNSGTIQLWRDNFVTHIWKHRNPNINDIAWVQGYPFLLAIGHEALFIYDASLS